ncbi:hypothetical protein RB620_08175 [Paenibacillus sp. LHD-117]|uniref:hypothetical protein n=1 Tax=Paenibacillus sp. LHD-117 TaxID=3071412 RepID=UPI0027DEB0D0|nr:hypothetical protein [Paenibacillus sp. LHD-117]MDQ6419405.1 hypothetical protein [Paenibacillus sp. LHD-117]
MYLNISGQVTPVCSRSHISYRFAVLRPTARLVVRFRYSPKELDSRDRSRNLIDESLERYTLPGQLEAAKGNWEAYLPLKNLLTLSVDDPQGHRGSAHRHDPQQLLHLAKAEASPGLEPGPIKPGMWAITVSLHAVVTETCDYELQVWGEEADECAG